MNKKQKINLAVWVILAAISFAYLFKVLLDDTPDYVWQNKGAFYCYYCCGFLSAVQTGMLIIPFFITHDLLKK